MITLVLSIQQEEFAVPITAEEQPDLLDIATHYQRGRGNFWVASAEERIVGTIGLLDVGNDCGVLRKMFVAASHRGAGVAAELLRACVRWARAAQMREILLGTTDQMRAAHRFYEKWGFVEVATPDLPSYFPRMRVDTKFYRYRLDP